MYSLNSARGGWTFVKHTTCTTRTPMWRLRSRLYGECKRNWTQLMNDVWNRDKDGHTKHTHGKARIPPEAQHNACQSQLRWPWPQKRSNSNLRLTICLSSWQRIPPSLCKYRRDLLPLDQLRDWPRGNNSCYIYKNTTRLWVDQVQSLGITPMTDTLPNYPTVQYLPVVP